MRPQIGSPRDGCTAKCKLSRSKSHDPTLEIRVEPFAKTVAANNHPTNPAKRQNRLTALGMLAPDNAKLSRSATLATLPTDTDDDLSPSPPVYIGFPHRGSMSLESAKDVGEKDAGEGSRAPQHTSTEPQTNKPQSGSDQMIRKRCRRGLKCPTTYKHRTADQQAPVRVGRDDQKRMPARAQVPHNIQAPNHRPTSPSPGRTR